MKWNRKNIAKRARIELRNGEKAIREQLETLREKADREIDRHAKDRLEREEPVTEPSGKSTGVLYGASLESATEHGAQVVPKDIVNDVGVEQCIPDTNDASVPLLVDVGSQDPPLALPLPERFDPFPEPHPEAATNATNVPLLVDVNPSPQDLPSQQSAAERQDPLPRREDLNGGIMNSFITSNSESFVGSSRAMPVAEVIPPRSTLATSTEIPVGSHARRSWNSRVPFADVMTSGSPQTNLVPSQSTPNLTDSHSVSVPSTLIKVTGYRMLNTAVVLMFGIWKGVASYRGESILSNTLDILMGVVFAIGLYWLGFLETSNPPCLIWLFHKDYAAPLRCSPTWRLPTSQRTSPGSLPYTSHDI